MYEEEVIDVTTDAWMTGDRNWAVYAINTEVHLVGEPSGLDPEEARELAAELTAAADWLDERALMELDENDPSNYTDFDARNDDERLEREGLL
jgi:hypothetical protein